eukprot:TRINITY_DN9240_c0_g1_i2.p2 TRINITY_DN9240_c0_g1~~TRINITY_DN9240_c0_g1_i2.p2  ORF type:complete len:148 (-),score=31.77 TRINITY_DN9240_c0_g1_i2:61-504(-)
MLYLNKFGLLMIYGGKNDTMYEAACLSDLYMLRLSNFNWIKINYFNNAKELPKADHFAFAVDTKIFTFGGFSDQGFNPLSIASFDLEYQSKSPQIKFGSTVQLQKFSFVKELELEIVENDVYDDDQLSLKTTETMANKAIRQKYGKI